MARTIPPAHPIEVREKAFQMYKQHKTFAEISEALAVKQSTIERWSCKGRWKDRRQSLVTHAINPGEDKDRKKIEEQDKADAERISNMSLSERQVEFEERMSVQALRVPKIMERMGDLVLIGAAEKLSKLAGEARKALKLEKDKPSTIINVALLAQPVAQPALPDKETNVIEIEAEIVEENN